MVLPPRADGRMLAALNLGHFGVKLHASDDAGASWFEVATPVYPPQPEGAPGPAWKLLQVWSLEAAHGTVWAGTLPGGLFRSGDFGRSWQLVESLWNQPGRLGWFGGGYDVPGIHSICPHPQRAGEVLVGISCGGAWVTRDDGASWTLQAERHARRLHAAGPGRRRQHPGPAPHRALRRGARRALVPASQRHLALHRQRRILAGGHHRAGLELRLRGGGRTRAIRTAPGSSRPRPTSAASRSTPRWSSTAPTTAPRSFTTLREGLPQRHCYDLVYRHGLALADDGQRLLIGSTTGNVWGSLDGWPGPAAGHAAVRQPSEPRRR